MYSKSNLHRIVKKVKIFFHYLFGAYVKFISGLIETRKVDD